MYIKQLDHPYLQLINNLDIHDDAAKLQLVNQLTRKKLLDRPIIKPFLILITCGYYYLKTRLEVMQSIDDAFSARKINTLHALTSTQHCLSRVYSKKEIEHLRNHPITEYQLLKALYFHRPPLKYKKVWQALFHSTHPPAPHDIDSINLYYDQLTSSHELSKEEIFCYLKKKIALRRSSSLTSKELQSAFKELIDSQEAS